MRKILYTFSLLLFSQFLSAATFTWTNGGGDNLWSNPTNWSVVDADTDGIPDADDILVFDATSLAHSNIDGNYSVNRLQVTAAYTGVLGLSTNTLTVTSEFTVANHGSFAAGTGTLRVTPGLGAIINSAAEVYNLEFSGFSKITLQQDLAIINNMSILSIGTLEGNFSYAVQGNVVCNDPDFRHITSDLTSNIEFVGSGNQTVTGTGTLEDVIYSKTGGTLDLSSFNASFGDFIVSGGVWDVAGSNVTALSFEFNTAGGTTGSGRLTGPITVGSGGTLGGDLSISGNVTVNSGGTVSPGNSPGLLSITGDLTMDSGSTLFVEVDGSVAGVDYDQVSVAGAVILNGATLDGVATTTTNDIVVIDNDGADAIAGTGFINAPNEGDIVTFGTIDKAVYYLNGDGNDVALNSSLLPVELVAFNAERVDEATVKLKWTTALEINVDGFWIERKLGELGEFSSVGWVRGAGNSVQLQNYTFVDENTFSGISYYRLRQVDRDGSEQYSPLSSVDGVRNTVTLFPVPAKDDLTVSFGKMNKMENEGEVQILDVQGKIIWSRSMTLQSNQSIALPISDLAQGVYVFQVRFDDGLVINERFIKE